MFTWFERLVDPFPDTPPATPPPGLMPFLWASTAGTRRYIAAMTLFTALIGAFEAWLFSVLGRVVDCGLAGWLGRIGPGILRGAVHASMPSRSTTASESVSQRPRAAERVLGRENASRLMQFF